MSELQQQVQAAIDKLVDSGEERGIQVAVFHRGQPVVEAVAGVADASTGRPVGSDTPFYNYSIVKGAAATIAHILVDRGLFGYDTPVAKIWPEFGARGKQTVTIRQVLNHSAGVPQIPLDTTPEDLCNWDKMCAAIADQELWWEPGTKIGYHAYTFGYIVGEVVRRATGKRISQLLADEVAGPLGVADEIYFGMPASQQPRLARLEDAPPDPQMAAQMAAMPAHVQGCADDPDADGPAGQSKRHPRRRYPGWRQDVGTGHCPDVCGVARSSGWGAAHLARAAAGGDGGLDERRRPGFWHADHLGAGVLNRSLRSKSAGVIDSVRRRWGWWQLRLRRHRQRDCIRSDQEPAQQRLWHGHPDRPAGQRTACGWERA